jgi:hypothetical protein
MATNPSLAIKIKELSKETIKLPMVLVQIMALFHSSLYL